MATVGRTSATEAREDDGPIAVRDFPAGCVSAPRRVHENSNRPGEASHEVMSLPDDFHNLSHREQFFERRRLFGLLWRFYSDSDTKRPDLKTMEHMRRTKTSFKFEGLGSVPGVEVGDTFDYRAEMYVVGLHRVEEAGIACIKWRDETVACSVVFSGGYRDDVDRGDVIEYTGHGGNDDLRVGKKEDQELRGGNLGLLNSLKRETPVRVIHGKTARGFRSVSQNVAVYKSYSYSGLYLVSEHKFVEGIGGRKVHKFTLVRQPGQSALGF